MQRYICIHGHFYQPPRENPWLEAIERQDSAYPYHDWNERITSECYAANARARILDGEGRIAKITNNYSKMSFNFGPTLMYWLEAKAPETYNAIVEADELSRDRFSGHGSALAQPYNHMILPLATRRDKVTQVVWGIRDFEHRFRRAPEGMWLPETAVDLETLDVLAEEGIRFTILEPGQAARVRRIGTESWLDLAGGRIDPSRSYRLNLPSGRRIALFFYDGPISRGVAFERLLSQGERFAHRLLSAFSEERDWPQLVHIATDGETYGHHHGNGDMALAYALDYIEAERLARLTNYGEYLDRHPPTHEVEIFENTAWSCAHGVGRWKENCGCGTGGRPEWNQAWRAPLRAALDGLRDALTPAFLSNASALFRDPTAARNDYIQVVLDRSPGNVKGFLDFHTAVPLDEAQTVLGLKLLEMDRHAQLMYTSCGWFFDDLSGIETVQILQYAGRAIQLAQEALGLSLEGQFLHALDGARSNLPEYGSGRNLYEKRVRPARVELRDVAAHFAVTSLFNGLDDGSAVYCYTVEKEEHHQLSAGRARFAWGTAAVRSSVTAERARVTFAVLHLGDHNLSGGVRAFQGAAAHEAMVAPMVEAFSRADVPRVLRLIDTEFGGGIFSLNALFRDEQRRIVSIILDSTLAEAEGVYRRLYEVHAPLMRFLADIALPLPRALQLAAEFALNNGLRRALDTDDLEMTHIAALLGEAEKAGVALDAPGLGFILKETIERLGTAFREHPEDLGALQRLDESIDLARSLPFNMNFWKTQNVFYDMLQDVFPGIEGRAAAGAGDPQAAEWVEAFRVLGEKLRIRV